MSRIFTTTIDAISTKVKLRNHRFTVMHTCAPEILGAKVVDAMLQFLQTPEGQAAKKECKGQFTYDELPMVPAHILSANGICSVKAEKADYKVIVNLETLFFSNLKRDKAIEEA